MFNLQGSELIIILLLALVVLGPEKLPDAMRKAGRMYADLKKMASGFQDEFRSVLDEPMREMRDTANLLRDSADFTKLAEGERAEKPKSGEMVDAAQMNLAPADPDMIPVDDLPFGPSQFPERLAGTDDMIPLDDLPFGPSQSPERPTGTDGFDELPDLSTVADDGESPT